MNVWTMAFDTWNEIEREAGLPLEVRAMQAQTLALLAIGQELSLIHHEGINPEFSAGD